MGEKIKKGDKVKVEYSGKLENGQVFDSSKSQGGQPLEFIAGVGQVVPGFDNNVVGMEKGEKKTFTIKPEEAYGERNEKMTMELERERFPKDVKLETGLYLMLKDQQGRQVQAKILEVGDEKVKLDMNHPLAGQNLTFDVEILEVEPGKTQAQASS